jgi:hypothetical protein
MIFNFLYFNLSGGAKIPEIWPNTQSWFFMPIILLPFTDTSIDFLTLKEAMELSMSHTPTLDKIEKLKKYIGDKLSEQEGVSLTDRRTLTKYKPDLLKLRYTDTNYRHLDGTSQERLLSDLHIKHIVDDLCVELLARHKGKEFIFNTIMNYGIEIRTPKITKDYLETFLPANPIPGDWINRALFVLPFNDLTITFNSLNMDHIIRSANKIFKILYPLESKEPPKDLAELRKKIGDFYKTRGVNLDNRTTLTTIFTDIKYESVDKFVINAESINFLLPYFNNICLTNFLKIVNFIAMTSYLDTSIFVQMK